MHVTLVLHTPLSLTYDAGRVLRGMLHSEAQSVADVVGVGLLVLGCCALLVRTRAGEPRAALTAAGLAMLLTTALSPVANYWYYLWCLPMLACCRLPNSAARCLVAFVGVLGVLAPLDPALHVPYTWLIVIGSVAVATILALLLPLACRRLVSRAW
jgi:alpha-1,6-mannosyltransferase